MATIKSVPKYGDKTTGDVKVLQRALCLNGYTVMQDDIFGPNVKSAVMAFQKANGLTGSGVVGPKTMELLGLKLESSLTPPTSPVVPAAGPQVQPLAEMALKIGDAFVGVIYEPKKKNDGAGVKFFQSWLDGDQTGEGWMKGQPWCATAASFCIWLAGKILGIKPFMLKSASSTELYAFAKKNKLLLPTPVRGCLALAKGSGGTSGKTHHHTCFVVDYHGGSTFTSLDGNFGDKMGYNTHNVADYEFAATC